MENDAKKAKLPLYAGMQAYLAHLVQVWLVKSILATIQVDPSLLGFNVHFRPNMVGPI